MTEQARYKDHLLTQTPPTHFLKMPMKFFIKNQKDQELRNF